MSRPKSEYISKLAVEENLNVVLVQETHTITTEDLENRGVITGFDMIVAEHSRSNGIATYVIDDIDGVNVVETSSNSNIYSSTIRIGSLSITNVYKAPTAQWTDTVLALQPHPAIYAGDFNSHHSEWNYRDDDENGEKYRGHRQTNYNWFMIQRIDVHSIQEHTEPNRTQFCAS